MDINSVVLVGRLTRDAETKQAGGAVVAKFALAVNRRVKSGDQWTDQASFLDCELWGKQAEALGKFLLKGKQVAIEGALKQDRWEQDGQSRSKVVVAVDNVQLLGGGEKSGGQSAQPAGDGFRDDIPF